MISSLAFAQYPIADTLTYIQRPLSNIPTIVKDDSLFTIEVEADGMNDQWQVQLLYKNLSFDLPLQSYFYFESMNKWFIQAGFPEDIPYLLYDLRVTSTGIEDTVDNAVKVIDNYRDDFYFIHITDSHLPTHIYYDEPGGLSDTSSMADLWSLIRDFEIINPEFVLFTGDIVNEGELEDYLEFRTYSRAKILLENFTVPVYLTGGNHDLGGWDETPPADGTARRDWWRFFGWKTLDQTSGPGPYTQDYYFDYSDIRFIEMEAYDNYDNWRSWIYGTESFTMLQIQWLADVLNATSTSMKIVTANHYDFNGALDIEELGIDMNLYGHIHYNSGSIMDYPYNLATDNICDGNRSFRVIYYDGQEFFPQNSFQAGGSGERFTVNYSPSNDGTHDNVTASIHNGYDFAFNHSLVVFKMPVADSYQVSRGTLKQVIPLASYNECHVELNLPANSNISVTIEIEEMPFLPGDANGDGRVIGSDVTYLVNYFRGIVPPPNPIYAADSNGDCLVTGADVTYLVNYFRGIGGAPVDGNCN